MSVSVLNTDAGLSGKTLLNTDDSQTIIGAKNFDRDPNPPFTVSSGSAKVDNLDADKVDGIEGAALLQLAGGTMSGLLTVNAGIKFPGTQVPSADVNTLDDYEEGTWMPVLGGASGQSGQAYSAQNGTYIKIGKLVSVTFIVTLTTKGTITGAVQVSGLPFVVGAGAANAVIPYYIALNTSWLGIGGHAFGASSAINLYGNTAAAVTVTPLATGDISNTTEIRGSLVYHATA